MSKSSTRAPTEASVRQTQLDHQSNQANANRGSKGTNAAYDHVQGNRGAQLNPNRKPR